MSNVAQTLEQTLSLGIKVWVGRAWSSFITYSVCHQSKHPPVIILLNVSDWWVMEGNTINSCFFGGRTLRLLQNFKFSLIIRRCANSELLRKSFWCFFPLCVYVPAYMCVYLLKGGCSLAYLRVCGYLRECVPVFCIKNRPLRALFLSQSGYGIPDRNAIRH